MKANYTLGSRALTRQAASRAQMVFNDFFEAHEASLGVRLHVLSSRRFANGFRFYEARRRLPINASALVAVSLVCTACSPPRDDAHMRCTLSSTH